jgi:hypothetical protein
LGQDGARALPPLLTLRPITVRLPEYVVRALETAAADAETTVDGLLHAAELIDFAGGAVERMEPILPGYRHVPVPGSGVAVQDGSPN